MPTLVDLGAAFVGAGGEGITRGGVPVPERTGVGVTFACPCGCGQVRYVPFANPLDGGEPIEPASATWTRSGETLETLTLSPSIQVRGGCGWHGYVRDGATVDA